MAGGGIIEEGTHDQLIAKKGHYHSIVNAQFTPINSIPLSQYENVSENQELFPIRRNSSATLEDEQV